MKKIESTSVWKGPCDSSDMGGVTQSMLGTYLVCKERFRLRYVEGLRTPERFEHKIEYGNLWHICEENWAANQDYEAPLLAYAKRLCQKYPLQQHEIDKWYHCCLYQFPVYAKYWSKNQAQLTPLMQEEVFKIPYTYTSQLFTNRKTLTYYLRGKFDSVFIRKDSKGKEEIWLQENKTKGDIDPEAIQRQLKFDLQTMLYLVALREKLKELGKDPNSLKGVRYNVVRRPLSGGKGNIKQLDAKGNRPAETKQEYFTRLQQYFIEEPDYWFMRWQVEVSLADIENFEEKCLFPVLYNLGNDYVFWNNAKLTGNKQYHKEPRNSLHYVTPFGLYNVLAEGGATEYDELIMTGNSVGLTRSNVLFPELNGEKNA